MRKTKKIIWIILILIFLVNTVNNISADADTQFILTNFDNTGSGNSSGTSQYITWESINNDTHFKTSTDYDLTPFNSFDISSNDVDLDGIEADEVGKGYFNLTTSDFEYIGFINMSFYSTGLHPRIWLKFYDSADNELIWIKYYGNNGLNLLNITWYDISTGTQYFVDNDDALSGNSRYYLTITHLNYNQFTLKLYNETFVLKKTASYGGASSNDWETFDYIYIYTDGSNLHEAHTYIDNFFISTTSEVFNIGDYDGGRCTNPIMGYDQIFEVDPNGCEPDWFCIAFKSILQLGDCIDCSYTLEPAKYIEHKTDSLYNETIRHVFLPVSADQLYLVSDDPDDYAMSINGEFFGTADYILPYEDGYAILWADVNKTVNGKILYSFVSYQHTTGYSKDWYWYGLGGFYGGLGTTKVHNSNSLFFDGVISGTYMGNYRLSVCWYYNDSSVYQDADPDDLPTIDEFDEAFGMGDEGYGYIEFLGYNENCYYKIGNDLPVPTLVYNLTGYGSGNGTKTYIYIIYKIDNGSVDDIVYTDFIEVNNRDYKRDIIELNDFDFDTYGSGRYYIMCYNTTDYGTTWNEFVHRSLTITVCPKSGGEGWDEGETYYGLPYWVPYLIGVFITLFITMSPLIIATYITRKTSYKKIDIPSLLYVGFFFMGLTVSVVMNFLPIWLPFVILFGMIIYFAVQWLYGKKGEITGE